jgi:hypothetical protein
MRSPKICWAYRPWRWRCLVSATNCERMYLIIRQFQRTQFGRHSERLDPDQLQLKLKEREIASAHERAAAEKRMTHPRAEPGVRKSLPAHLPHDFGRRVMRMQCWAGMTSSRSDFSSPITSIRLPRVRRRHRPGAGTRAPDPRLPAN